MAKSKYTSKLDSGNQTHYGHDSLSGSENSGEEAYEEEPLLMRHLESEAGAAPAEERDIPWYRRLLEHLYGPSLRSNAEHLPRVLYLSALLCCIIGSFWLLDSLKDTVFATVVGLEHQPTAKLLSVGCTVFLVLLYNSLLDRVETPTLFYLVGGGYTVVFGLIAFALSHESIGMDNVEANSNRFIGWVSYFAIESYGSIAVALFWAFANSTTTLELAEASYGLILAVAQLGAIAGSTIATLAKQVGVARLYGAGALACFSVPVMIKGYVLLFPAHLPPAPSLDRARQSKESPWSSMCTGLFLVARYEYMQLVFGVSCLYEVVLTVLDYEMKVIGRARFGADKEGAESFAALMGHFGQLTNGLSFLLSLFAFSFIVRTLGLKRTLRVFPCLLVLAVLVSLWFAWPSLWVLFGTMSVLKALTFAVDEPSKELLYMPTSDAVKFKAKAWIDVVGARSMKAFGSAITHAAKDKPERLARYGGVPTLLVSLALLGISILVGKQFEDLVKAGTVIGADLEDEDDDDDDDDDASGRKDDGDGRAVLDGGEGGESGRGRPLDARGKKRHGGGDSDGASSTLPRAAGDNHYKGGKPSSGTCSQGAFPTESNGGGEGGALGGVQLSTVHPQTPISGLAGGGGSERGGAGGGGRASSTTPSSPRNSSRNNNNNNGGGSLSSSSSSGSLKWSRPPPRSLSSTSLEDSSGLSAAAGHGGAHQRSSSPLVTTADVAVTFASTTTSPALHSHLLDPPPRPNATAAALPNPLGLWSADPGAE